MNAPILVVEDDPDTRELVTLFLEQAGFHVVRAKDGVLAMEMLRPVKPRLILLDIAMPGMSGLEVLDQVRRVHRLKTPVAMMTANGEASTIRTALAQGADGYILKPFKAANLVKRVRALLEPEPRAGVHLV